MLDTTRSGVAAAPSPGPELFSGAAPLHVVDRLGEDRTVQIATVGRPRARRGRRVHRAGTTATAPALNSRVLSAMSRVAVQQERAESLLSIIDSKHFGRILSDTGAVVRPLSIHRYNGTEEISA